MWFLLTPTLELFQRLTKLREYTVFTAETRSSQRSEYFLIKNTLLGALSASAVSSGSRAYPTVKFGVNRWGNSQIRLCTELSIAANRT